MKTSKKIFRNIAFSFILISLNLLSYGQFQGKQVKNKTYTVSEIKKNATMLDRTDAIVKVKGNIIQQLNSETYVFMDKTGIIRAKIEKKVLPKVPFDEKTDLILVGEVDNDIFEPVEIEVKEMIILEKMQ
ncbi:MAG: YgiW/YdeI family stress tolerance OB fold protein [Bacteroidales bacterium]|jgi:uncharacterized protein (TIGR00156 family)